MLQLLSIIFYIVVYFNILLLNYAQTSNATIICSRKDHNTIKRSTIISKIIICDDIYEDVRSERKQSRRPKYKFNRINLKEHFKMCRATDGFQRRFHMSEDSFQKLVDILKDDLSINEAQSRRCTQGNAPITLEMVLAIGLRYMGGEHAKSLADIYGMHIKSAERVIGKFLNAVDKSTHPFLSIDNLPKTEMERRKVALEWSARSGAFHVFHGVLGAIDGWLCTTEKPSDVPNPSNYYSGHYQRFGFNVQALCDANLRFIYSSVINTPGFQMNYTWIQVKDKSKSTDT